MAPLHLGVDTGRHLGADTGRHLGVGMDRHQEGAIMDLPMSGIEDLQDGTGPRRLRLDVVGANAQ